MVGLFHVLQMKALGELEGPLELPSSPACSVSPSDFFCYRWCRVVPLDGLDTWRLCSYPIKIPGLHRRSNNLTCHQEIPEMYAQHQSEELGMFSQDKREPMGI